MQATAAGWRDILRRRAPLFVVRGVLDDEEVEARWVRGVGLVCPPRLLEQAQLVVGMGETFAAAEGEATFVATLDAPTEAMLTIMRALSRIRSVDIGPALVDRSRRH